MGEVRKFTRFSGERVTHSPYVGFPPVGSNVNQPTTIGTSVIDSITDTGFVISCLVTPGSSPVTPALHWGLTTGYAGTPVDATEGEISEATTCHFTVTGATQNSLYHFKVVAVEVESSDATLTTLNTELITYETGLTTALSSAQRTRLNTLISALKTATSSTALSDAFDFLYIDANETAEAAVKNIVQNLYHCTLVNSPAFAAFEGFTGNGSNMYIRTGYKLLTNAIRYSRDSASSGAYLRKNLNELRAVNGAANASTAGSVLALRISTNTSFSLVNNAYGTDTLTGVIDTRGMWIQNRVASTGHKLWQNKNVVLDKTVNSAALVDFEDYWLCYNENNSPQLYSNQQVAIRFKGRGLTDAEIAGITDAFEVYMLSVNRSVRYASKPYVAFTFDDGYTEWNTLLKTAFDNSNKKCTFYLVTGLPTYLVSIGQYPTNKITDAAISELIAAGFDVQCHTNTHPNLTTITEAQVLAEYDAVNAYFSARGWPAPKHTAYPGYSTNANVQAYTATKRLTARGGSSGVSGLFNSTRSLMYLLTKSINLNKDDATALAGVKAEMDTLVSGVTTNNMLTFNGHRVYNDADADPFANNSLQLSYLVDLLAYCDTKAINVVTIDQLYNIMINLKVTV